ncbi:class I SAM-dependent methyltransferase [Anaerosinus gibii]|uniref:Class I SAM-dependent methyltransferase n=1 Tax=Selenobaculum gibii TaxID=3054208 RepID=A0A9Y2ER70_9FIRM|nr:class I SAM-dependent methyltransferase [Selenobaculum gbiensis]WIW70847.1 class I SAM-dependent methyltransferase [Selenobaculum gbiensis]
MNFNQLANEWDDARRIKRAATLSGVIMDELPEKKFQCGLEFGCGTGLISCNLQHRFEKLHCIDNADAMIDIVKQKIEQLCLSHCFAHCADLSQENIFFDKKIKFDCIFTSMALHHVVDTDGIISRFYSLLDDDGLLVIIDLDSEDGTFHQSEVGFEGHNGFDRLALEQILYKNNFKQICFKTAYTGGKMIEGREVSYSLFICIAKK